MLFTIKKVIWLIQDKEEKSCLHLDQIYFNNHIVTKVIRNFNLVVTLTMPPLIQKDFDLIYRVGWMCVLRDDLCQTSVKKLGFITYRLLLICVYWKYLHVPPTMYMKVEIIHVTS